MQSTPRMTHVLVVLTDRRLYGDPWDYRGISTGTICDSAQVIVHLEHRPDDALVLAHEIAHVLGARHDNGPGFIMAERNAGKATQFSPATLRDIWPLLPCIRDKP